MYSDPVTPTPPRLGTYASLAVEIDWALSSAHQLGRRSLRPAVENLYRNDPALVERISGLWGPDETLSYPGYLELSVLAHQGDVLFATDSDELLGRLDGLAADAPVNLAVPSETPDDQVRLTRRLKALRGSAKRRRHYVATVTEVWSALRDGWEAEGRPAVEREVANRQAMIARQVPWREFADNECSCGPTLDTLYDRLGPDGELAVVPAWFNHTGLVIGLPDVVVVGVTTDDEVSTDRNRAELLARRLKAAADPTRMALLAGLARREMTVSELAEQFSLAQPTVSNHVKLLRDAGLIGGRSDGRNRYLTIRRDAFADLQQDMRQLLRLDEGAG